MPYVNPNRFRPGINRGSPDQMAISGQGGIAGTGGGAAQTGGAPQQQTSAGGASDWINVQEYLRGNQPAQSAAMKRLQGRAQGQLRGAQQELENRYAAVQQQPTAQKYDANVFAQYRQGGLTPEETAKITSGVGQTYAGAQAGTQAYERPVAEQLKAVQNPFAELQPGSFESLMKWAGPIEKPSAGYTPGMQMFDEMLLRSAAPSQFVQQQQSAFKEKVTDPLGKYRSDIQDKQNAAKQEFAKQGEAWKAGVGGWLGQQRTAVADKLKEQKANWETLRGTKFTDVISPEAISAYNQLQRQPWELLPTLEWNPQTGWNERPPGGLGGPDRPSSPPTYGGGGSSSGESSTGGGDIAPLNQRNLATRAAVTTAPPGTHGVPAQQHPGSYGNASDTPSVIWDNSYIEMGPEGSVHHIPRPDPAPPIDTSWQNQLALQGGPEYFKPFFTEHQGIGPSQRTAVEAALSPEDRATYDALAGIMGRSDKMQGGEELTPFRFTFDEDRFKEQYERDLKNKMEGFYRDLYKNVVNSPNQSVSSMLRVPDRVKGAYGDVILDARNVHPLASFEDPKFPLLGTQPRPGLPDDIFGEDLRPPQKAPEAAPPAAPPPPQIDYNPEYNVPTLPPYEPPAAPAAPVSQPSIFDAYLGGSPMDKWERQQLMNFR